MIQQRDGGLRSARASVASFPPANEAGGRRPSHADSSHIARRRASSAHEVGLDDVQLVDEVDALDLQKTVKLSPPASRRPRLMPAAVVCSALVGGGIALFARPEPTRVIPTPTPTSTSTSTSTSTPTSTSTSTSTSTAPSTPSAGIPVVDIATLPRPRTGVILGSPGHRLWIDGALVRSWRTTVACGPHTVQVGSAGAIRDVDVPCGAEINVQP
jgi:hypothetical protein